MMQTASATPLWNHLVSWLRTDTFPGELVFMFRHVGPHSRGLLLVLNNFLPSWRSVSPNVGCTVVALDLINHSRGVKLLS